MRDNPNSEYIAHDDEAEAKQMRDLGGYGESIITDEEVKHYSLDAFGLGINPADFYRNNNK